MINERLVKRITSEEVMKLNHKFMALFKVMEERLKAVETLKKLEQSRVK